MSTVYGNGFDVTPASKSRETALNYPKWEYLELTEDQNSDEICASILREDPARKSVSSHEREEYYTVYDAIRELGLNGWEMCGCDCATDTWRFYFKRPLQPYSGTILV